MNRNFYLEVCTVVKRILRKSPFSWRIDVSRTLSYLDKNAFSAVSQRSCFFTGPPKNAFFCCFFEDARWSGVPGVEVLGWGNWKVVRDPLTVHRCVQGLLGVFLDLSGDI